MTVPCRNDCAPPPGFPKPIENRPGLSRIGYRIGTYAEIRDALLRALDTDPVLLLAGWTHRGADDPGIALLEGAAILGDILTFYQERYANEAFLRTAAWRESVADLVRLLGYRLSPGVGGRGTFAFEIRGDAKVTVPKGFPLSAQVTGLEQQADFETVDELVAFPWFSKFSLLRRQFIPNLSGTTREISVEATDPSAPAVTLEKGDRLLVGTLNSALRKLSHAEIVLVDSVRQLHGETFYRLKGALTQTASATELTGYKLGRSFRHFGHNGPFTTTEVTGTTPTATPVRLQYERSLADRTEVTDGPPKLIVDPELEPEEFPLDVDVADLAAGTPTIIQGVFPSTISGLPGEEFAFIRTIQAANSRSMTWGIVSGGTTVVTVDAALATPVPSGGGGGGGGVGVAGEIVEVIGFRVSEADIRTVRLHETASPQLTIRARPEPIGSPTTGRDLDFVGSAGQVQTLQGRRLLLLYPDREPVPASVQSIVPSSTAADRIQRRGITLDVDVDYADFPIESPTVTVYGNVVDATQGKTERETALGNGDAREEFQTFKLPKAPLTYLLSVGATPPEVPQLAIYVGERLWSRVDSFFGRGPKEEIYIVREDAAGDSWVQFGDGRTGSRLPSGLQNVVAKWRTGNGAYGALKEGTTVQAAGKLDRLDKIGLPDVVSGGDGPESAAHAREAAPGKVQSLGRLVSVADYESETLAIPGVARARAAWALVENVPSVVVTVLMATGRDAEFATVAQTLASYDRCRGPQRYPVIVRQGYLAYVYLDVSFILAAAFREEIVTAAVAAALGVTGDEGRGIDGSQGLLAQARRQFGAREYATRVEAVVQQVEGVVSVRVNGFGRLGQADDPATLAAPPTPWTRSERVDCAADEILALYTDHLELRPGRAPSSEACP